MNAEQSQLPSGVRRASSVRSSRSNHVPAAVDGAAPDTRRGTSITALKSLFGKEKLANFKALRRACAGLVVLAAALGASLNAAAEPVQSPDQAPFLRTMHAPRNVSAVAEGPTRVALSWQAPSAADEAAITGYGIQFSDDGGANWSVLPSIDRRTTSLVHTVGLHPNTSLLYRVFSISEEGAGPAAVVSAATPAMAMPRIVGVTLGTDQGTTRWYPPRRDIVVTVQFDQAVKVNTKHGTPRVVLEMGRPPHRQSGYTSDYSDGSGTDRLTFRYSALDWNQDIRDIEVGPNALHRNGARITNVHASHSASLAHGPANLEDVPQVDAQSDAALVMDSPEAAPAPAAPEADQQVTRNEESSSPAFAVMLTAAGALVAGTEIVKQLALTEERRSGQRASSDQLPGTSGQDGEETLAVAVDLGEGAGPRAAVNASKPGWLSLHVNGMTKITLYWSSSTGGTIEGYLIEYSDDDGLTWENLLGSDEQGDDTYHPASSRSYQDTTLTPGATRSYRVSGVNSDGPGTPSDAESATTEQMVAVPACDSAFWSTVIIVGYHSAGPYYGYNTPGGTNAFGSITDGDFSFGGTTYAVISAYFAPARSFYGTTPAYHFNLDPALPDDRKDDLTVYIGQVELSLASSSNGAQESWHQYQWRSAQYAGTFDKTIGDWVTVCLVDNSPGVSLTLTPDSISENGGSSTVTATVANASSTPFTVTVSAEPDSPAVDADFTLSTNKVLSFAANATDSTGTVTIAANDNSVHALDKTITVKGELSSGTELRAPDDVTLTITDDDAAPQLSFGVSPATIAEDGGEATVTVSTVDSTFSTQQVITLTFEGAATKGTDYSVAAETLTLGVGERSVSTTVTATDDAIDESDETILVTATHDGSTVGTQQQITIADTLAAEVSDHSSNVNEGDDAEFTVTLTGGTSTADVEVIYAVDTDSTATSGDDYTAPSGKLTIAAGQSSGTITIGTETDEVHDPGETVVLKLTSATTDTRTVNVDDTVKVTTTIGEQGMETVSVGPVLVEDDAQTPNVDETDDKSSVEEGETASFVVTLSGEVSGTVSVTYTTANGTAESGTGKDYTTASGTLQFAAGDLSKTIEVTTLEDVLNEASETYTLTLTAATGVSGVSLGTASATGTIEDDDALTAALGTHTANVAEGSEATFEVDLSGGTSTADGGGELRGGLRHDGDVGGRLHGAEREADDRGGPEQRNDHDRDRDGPGA